MKAIGKGTRIYCVGIKGTGMAALAEYCHHAGALVEGSDIEEIFYTDAILSELGISVYAPFNEANLPDNVDILFYSAAYDPQTHPELVLARSRGIECLSYPEALGKIAEGQPTGAVAGVHGKTTTTAMSGTLAEAVGLPTGVIVGSAVANFNNRSCLFLGTRALIAETCEYRRHFLNVHPRWLLVTSIEPDHLDYYSDYDDIFSAFLEYTRSLPSGGSLIYCADNEGAVELAQQIAAERPDVRRIPYGFQAPGRYRIISMEVAEERLLVTLEGFSTPFRLRIPGRHSAQNIAAAAALVEAMAAELATPLDTAALVASAESFMGSKRRSELIGEAEDIIFMDDYAHHPTAIRTTLEGLRQFYPNRRIVADFMSHTYSRTAALLDGFASAFDAADLVVLHDIYASAREEKGGITGETLYRRTAANHPRVEYIADPAESIQAINELLRPGDLLITMGAGNNWVVSHRIFELRKDENK